MNVTVTKLTDVELLRKANSFTTGLFNKILTEYRKLFIKNRQ